MGRWLGGDAAEGVEDEIDDGVGEEGDDETDDGVEDGVFRIGDFLAVAAGNDITEATPDEHDDGKRADDAESDISEAVKDAVDADELGGHAFGAGGFGTLLDGESHDFAGAQGKDSAKADDGL